METVESLEQAINVIDGIEGHGASALMLEYAQFVLAAGESDGVNAIVAAVLADVESANPKISRKMSEIIYGADTEVGTDSR